MWRYEGDAQGRPVDSGRRIGLGRQGSWRHLRPEMAVRI
jgi:hypothetical protein